MQPQVTQREVTGQPAGVNEMRTRQGTGPADTRRSYQDERGKDNATRDDALGTGPGQTTGKRQAEAEMKVVNDGDGNRGSTVAGNSRGGQQSTTRGIAAAKTTVVAMEREQSSSDGCGGGGKR